MPDLQLGMSGAGARPERGGASRCRREGRWCAASQRRRRLCGRARRPGPGLYGLEAGSCMSATRQRFGRQRPEAGAPLCGPRLTAAGPEDHQQDAGCGHRLQHRAGRAAGAGRAESGTSAQVARAVSSYGRSVERSTAAEAWERQGHPSTPLAAPSRHSWSGRPSPSG